jgi:hypothetical protein
LYGSLDLYDENGLVWQTFEVEIHRSMGFPSRFPLIYEVGGLIPPASDWHINVGDEDLKKSCCIAVLPTEVIACAKGITVVDFIKQYALPYFYKQAYRLNYGYYPGMEYPHGLEGVWVYYRELFNVDNNENILKILTQYSKSFHKKSLCFCGNGNKFRNCHPEVYRTLRSMPEGFITWQLKALNG